MITPFEETPKIITPFEEVKEVLPTQSLLSQGKIVINNSPTEESIKQLQLSNIEQSSVNQVRETARVIKEQTSAIEFQSLLSQESDVDTLALALGKIKESRENNMLALEESVVDTLAKQMQISPEQQFITANERSFFDNIREREIKNLAVYNKIQEIQQDSDLGDTALNLLSEVSLVNFLQRSFGFGVLGYTDELRDLQIRLERAPASEATRILEESAELIKATEILGSNPDYIAGELSVAFTGSNTEQRTAGIFNFLDFVDTAFIGFGVAKGLGKTAKNLGNTQQLADDITEGTDTLVSDPIEKIQMGAGLVTKFDGASDLPAKVRMNYEVNQRILDMSLRGNKAISYDEVRRLDVVEGIRERLKKDFTNGSINDIRVLDDGNAEVMIFTVGGDAYKTEGMAKTQLTKRGLEGEVVKLGESRFAIKARVPALDAEIANLSTKGVNFFRRFLSRPESWVDDKLHLFGQVSEQALNQITKQGQIVYDRTIGKLGSKEIDRILPVLELQRTRERWLEPKEIKEEYMRLHGKPIPNKELDALAGFELLDRFAYELDNKTIYQKKKALGFQSVDEDVFGIQVNGKVVEDFPKDDIIFDSNSGTVIRKDELPEDYLVNNTVLEVDDINGFKGRDGFENLMTSPTKYISVPADRVKLRELDYQQLAYLQGGRNRYDRSTIFLKQADLVTRSDGKKVRKNDKTLFTATSMPQAKREVAKINEINARIRKDPDSPETQKWVDDYLSTNGPVLGMVDFKGYMARFTARGGNINEDLVPLRNRESIESQNLPSEFTDDDVIREISNGRLSARGDEGPPHIIPEETSLLNPVASLNQNFVAAANNLAFSAYRDYALAHMERYRRFLAVKENDPRINLLSAPIRENANLTPEQMQRIRGEQQFSREVVGRLDVDEMAAVEARERRIEYITDRLPLKDKDKAVARMSEYLKEDPIGRVRGLVFNAKLGLFSLPAMAIQMAHAPIISVMSPHGLKSLLAYPALRIGLVSNDPKVIAEMAKKAEALGWDGFGDMQKFFQEFRNLGFDSFGSNMIYENAARGDDVGRNLGTKFLDKSRIFFEEGELVPRITGYATAVREWTANYKNINPKKLPIDSKEGSEYLTQRTNTLTLGMTRADLQQGLKSGLSGLAFQFQSYPLRAMDALLFPSKGLSKAERIRMGLAYLGMFGAAGLPLVTSMTNYFMSKNPDTFDATTSKFIYNGIVDGLTMAITGENTNFASRGGLGTWIDQLLDDAANGRVLEMVTGPAGSTFSGATDTLTQYMQAYSAGFHPDPSQITTGVIMDVAKQVSSFNNLYRSWVAYNTGMIYDKRGSQFIEISSKGNLLQLFGLPPQAYEDIGMFYSSKEKRREVLNLVKKQKILLHNEYVRTDSPERRQDIINELNMISHYAQKDGILEEVNASVYRTLAGDSTYKQLHKDAALKDALGEKGVYPTKIRSVNE